MQVYTHLGWREDKGKGSFKMLLTEKISGLLNAIKDLFVFLQHLE